VTAAQNRWRVGCPNAWAPEVQAAIKAAAPPALEVVFDDGTDPEAWPRLVAESDFLLVAAERLDAALIGRAAKLRLIHKWGIGVDAIDLAAARDAGIGVAITAGGNAHAVAEHTVLLMLAVLRRLPLVDHAMREGRWLFKEMRVQCQQVLGKTIGIVGAGNIGRAVARRLQGFEANLVYYDPRRVPPELERQLGLSFMPMERLLAESHIVTLHCPGGEENRHLFDAGTFARMRQGAVLINAARGEIVEESALVEALRSGHLMGAGLDVYEEEPVAAGNPLLAFDNVVLTPHTAASVFDNVERIARHAFANMLRTLDGEPLPDADVVVAPHKK
jgi:phosphoglycerate dehydrogenase-like enzyme